VGVTSAPHRTPCVLRCQPSGQTGGRGWGRAQYHYYKSWGSLVQGYQYHSWPAESAFFNQLHREMHITLCTPKVRPMSRVSRAPARVQRVAMVSTKATGLADGRQSGQGRTLHLAQPQSRPKRRPAPTKRRKRSSRCSHLSLTGASRGRIGAQATLTTEMLREGERYAAHDLTCGFDRRTTTREEVERRARARSRALPRRKVR